MTVGVFRGKLVIAMAPALLLLVLGGCASRKYVQREVGLSDEREAERIEVIQSQIENAEMKLAKHDEEIMEISMTAQEALDRAIAAGELAEGQFLYETVLSDDKVRFGFDQAELSPEATEALDWFGAGVKERNEDVYIEIQGHTDSIGSEKYNLRLGETRAEVVRRYLNSKLGLPLHRMAVISYGETAPVTDNGNREDRARNRRVALVVLQ